MPVIVRPHPFPAPGSAIQRWTRSTVSKIPAPLGRPSSVPVRGSIRRRSPRRCLFSGAKVTLAARVGSRSTTNCVTALPSRWRDAAAISASGDNAGAPPGASRTIPGLIALWISSSNAIVAPVTPMIASTNPAVIPRNQWTWNRMPRNVIGTTAASDPCVPRARSFPRTSSRSASANDNRSQRFSASCNSFRD